MTAALISRSQTRMQLRAEHIRALGEPRRRAYISFTESFYSTYNELSDAGIYLSFDDSLSNHERAQALRRAREHFDAAHALRVQLERHTASTHVEGPQKVTNAAIEAMGKLTDFRHIIAVVLDPDASDPSFTADDIRQARLATYQSYLNFLYAASEALTQDGLSPID